MTPGDRSTRRSFFDRTRRHGLSVASGDPVPTEHERLVPQLEQLGRSDWHGSSYGYDACRGAWRVAVDYAWSGDPRAKAVLERIAARIAAEGGIPVGAFANNSAFQGAFALAA